MALIDVSQAEVGMVLATDVTDRRGRMLIPAGKELTDRYVNALPMWGVTHIEVEGDGPASAETEIVVEEWAREKAGQEIEAHFVHANKAHPAIAELMTLCLNRRAVEVQAEGLGR